MTYDDISTVEDRLHWIAGSSLKVIDLQTNEVSAERVGYMMDFRQGDVSGVRSPWLEALDHACPAFIANPNRLPGPALAATDYQADRFFEKLIYPQISLSYFSGDLQPGFSSESSCVLWKWYDLPSKTV